MATRNDEVMEMVRRELDQRPDVELRELYERAQEIDPQIRNLSTRQFHAQYPLQIKRARTMSSRAAAGGGGEGARRGRASQERSGPRTRRTAQEPEAAPPEAQTQPRVQHQRQTRRTQAQGRDAIRGVFLRFAGEVAQAETRSEVVGVLSNVDAYVDDVMKVLNRS